MKNRKPTAVLFLLFALAIAALPALAADEVVNVNEADESQLALLPRVGPALAGRIAEFRETNGKFKQVEDLMLVRGIGEKTMDLLAPFVTTSGKTTLTNKVSLSRAQEAADSGARPKQDDDTEKKDGEG